MSIPLDDTIIIRSLSISVCLGVPEEERATPQTILLHLTLTPLLQPFRQEDTIESTIDYQKVCEHIADFASQRSYQLVETLSHAIASDLLEHFPLKVVQLELHKHILPQTQSVGVSITRYAPGYSSFF